MLFQNAINVFYFIAGVYILLLGWLILRENPRQKVSRILAVLLFLAALGPLFTALGLLVENNASAAENFTQLFRYATIWEFFFPQLVLFSLVFPTQHKALNYYPRLYILFYLPQAMHFVLVVAFDSAAHIQQFFDLAPFFETVPAWFKPINAGVQYVGVLISWLFEHHRAYFSGINFFYIFAALALMHLSFAKITSYALREQVKMVLWGLRVSTGLYALSFLLPDILKITVKPSLSHTFTLIGLALGAGGITWAIIRHQFLEIKYIIRRGFIVSVSSGLLVAIYLLLYGEVRQFARNIAPEHAQFVEAGFLILTVIGFQPFLNLIENTVDRLLRKRLGNYAEALQELNREILTLFKPEQLRERVTNVLTESMLIDSVYLFLPQKPDGFATPIRGERGGELFISNDSPILDALLNEKRALFLSEIDGELWQTEEHRRLQHYRANLLFPLHHRGERYGVLALGRKITRTAYTVDELNRLSLLADQLAIALENLGLYQEMLVKQQIERELAVAKEIQRLLLPTATPQNDHYELSAMSTPSYEIGGDYYDLIELPGEKLGVAIGDVSGKGIPGAMLMSNLQAVFRTFVVEKDSPAKLVECVNDHLAKSISAQKYITFFYGVLDYKKRRLTFTNAGHNYPLLCRKKKIITLKDVNLILGAKANIRYEESIIQLEKGDTLLLYTDGLTETIDSDDRLFGEERLEKTLSENCERPLNELVDQIYSTIDQYTQGKPPIDDLTIVAVRIK